MSNTRPFIDVWIQYTEVEVKSSQLASLGEAEGGGVPGDAIQGDDTLMIVLIFCG